MGGFFSLAFADGVGFIQNWHYGSRAERFAKLGYELDFQGLRLDVLSTIREEIRDQVFVIISSLDNLMVVATLMLSLGFGFVVEGTFPPHRSEQLQKWTIESIGFSVSPLVVYAFLCAMSLVCPFWCLVFSIRMRYEVDLIIREHMKELKRQLWNVLKKDDQGSSCSTTGNRAAGSTSLEGDRRISTRSTLSVVCPRRLKNAYKGCPQRQRDDLEQAMDGAANTVAGHVGPFSLDPESKWIDQELILKWAGKDLLQRARTFHFYLKASHVLLWVGMLSAIFTCALLLGMYMQVNFPHTPLVWFSYSSIVGINGGLAIVFAVWMWLSGSSPVITSEPKNPEQPCLDRTISSFNSDDPRSLRSRSSIFPLNQPFLNKSPNDTDRIRKKGWNATSSASETSQTRMVLRVRDTSRNLDAFRQIHFPVQRESDGCYLGPVANFVKLESLICAKFSGADGNRARSLSTLVRLRDRLEIIDSEDVTLLQDGDELGATFSYV